MHDTDSNFYSWLAGLVDGDGSIYCQHRILESGYHTHKNPGVTFSPKIVIALLYTDAHALEYIQQKTGMGKIYDRKERGKSRLAICWQTTNRVEAKTLAQKLLPYLVIKKKQAQTVIEICQILENHGFGYGRATLKRLPRTEMKRISYHAATMNPNHNPNRYRHCRTPEQWGTLIDEIYDARQLP